MEKKKTRLLVICRRKMLGNRFANVNKTADAPPHPIYSRLAFRRFC